MSVSVAQQPGIVAPQLRDLDELGRLLVGWLEARIPHASGMVIDNLDYPRGAGMSHETILFDARWTEHGERRNKGMVVRIKPLRNTVFLDDLFDRQYRLMQLMHGSALVRVAQPLWFEEDVSLLGAPFFVMEKKEGRVAVSYPPYSRDGWLVETAPADRRRVWEDSVRQLALIQHVPVADAQFLTLPGGSDGFDQEADRWRRFLQWVDPGGSQLLLRTCFDRLLAGRPANRPEGIVWGDARLGNMMIGPDFAVAAVMDWEQPSLGGALHDLGWWLVHDQGQTIGQGLARLSGMGSREDTISLWSEVAGKSAADIEWYEAFAGFKMECLGIRMTSLREMPSGPMNIAPGVGTARILDGLGL